MRPHRCYARTRRGMGTHFQRLLHHLAQCLALLLTHPKTVAVRFEDLLLRLALLLVVFLVKRLELGGGYHLVELVAHLLQRRQMGEEFPFRISLGSRGCYLPMCRKKAMCSPSGTSLALPVFSVTRLHSSSQNLNVNNLLEFVTDRTSLVSRREASKNRETSSSSLETAGRCAALARWVERPLPRLLSLPRFQCIKHGFGVDKRVRRCLTLSFSPSV